MEFPIIILFNYVPFLVSRLTCALSTKLFPWLSLVSSSTPLSTSSCTVWARGSSAKNYSRCLGSGAATERSRSQAPRHPQRCLPPNSKCHLRRNQGNMTSRCRTLGADDVLTRTSTVTLYVTPFNRGSFFLISYDEWEMWFVLSMIVNTFTESKLRNIIKTFCMELSTCTFFHDYLLMTFEIR